MNRAAKIATLLIIGLALGAFATLVVAAGTNRDIADPDRGSSSVGTRQSQPPISASPRTAESVEASPLPPGRQEDLEQSEWAAREFLKAYGSFDWRDPEPQQAVRQRTRPFATDELNRFLDGGSSGAYRLQQRIDQQEIATVEIVAIDAISPSSTDLITYLALIRSHTHLGGDPVQLSESFYELTVARRGGKWLVDRIET